ncbi:reverse transcriptase domain-containing protein [Tanacetum coccineum]
MRLRAIQKGIRFEIRWLAMSSRKPRLAEASRVHWRATTILPSGSLHQQIGAIRHISALKELLKEPNNRNLIKPMLLDFEDSHDVSDDEVQDNGEGKAKMDEEDLSKPFKEILKCPFTRRIIEFSSPGHKMPTNVKTYDGTGDPEDYIGRFVGAGNQGEWPMLVWCMMFQQTLDGKARAWFDKLLSGSIDNWGSLQEKFLNSSHKCPELAKRFSDSIPKTVDEMLKRVDDYLRSEEEILATEHQLKLPQPAPLVGAPNKENLNRYCDYHNEKGHNTNDCFHLKRQLEMALESGKLNHLVKDVRQRGKGNQRNNGPQKAKVINTIQSHPLGRKQKTTMRDEGWMNVPITFPSVPARDLSEEPLVVEAEVEGYLVRRIHIDEGASIEIMFEHCFNMLHPAIQARLVETQTTVSGFSGEQVKPLGKIELDVCFGGNGRCRRAIMKFTVIPAPSPYNIILGRPGLRQLRAIPSTIHGIMKFPTPWGVATIVSQATMVLQCGSERKKQVGELPEEVKVLNDTSPTEHVLINPAYPEQLVVIGKNLSPEGLA